MTIAWWCGIANARVGGGLWCPEAQPLSLLRRDIDRKPHRIKRVLTDAGIRKAFLGGIGADQKKAVKAFTNHSENKSNALKKNPKVSELISFHQHLEKKTPFWMWNHDGRYLVVRLFTRVHGGVKSSTAAQRG